MLNSCRLKTIVLLVAVMASGFVLFGTFLVQEAAAHHASACDIAQAQRDAWCGIATYVCNSYGWESDACLTYVLKCRDAAQRVIDICQN